LGELLGDEGNLSNNNEEKKIPRVMTSPDDSKRRLHKCPTGEGRYDLRSVSARTGGKDQVAKRKKMDGGSSCGRKRAFD